jgi:hypothetical protein
MIKKIISGGQTGVDINALRAAKPFIKTGGWMTRGFKNEDGKFPEYATKFNLKQMAANDYPARTQKNIRNSDGTLLIVKLEYSPGTKLAQRLCWNSEKPCFTHVVEDFSFEEFDFSYLIEWIKKNNIRVLNVGGNRKSKVPEIGDYAFKFITELLNQLNNGVMT